MKHLLRRTVGSVAAAAAVIASVPVLPGRAAPLTPHEGVLAAPASPYTSSDQRRPPISTSGPSLYPRAGDRSLRSGGATAPAPFLTRPYWHHHNVGSIFDHCNPTYVTDDRICQDDGSVAVRSNGVDPYFTRGYAATPGGTNYVYYDGHNGYDIDLNYENLIAAADGVVQIAGQDPNNGGYGINVVIDHQNGFSTRYAHMSQVWVQPGQHVVRGEGIGISGNTGASTGPHLHFGLYVTSSWTAIDPWGWNATTADPWPADSGNLWITGNPQDPVPGAPTNVSAVAAVTGATVSWTPPSFDGGNGVDHYTITAMPGSVTNVVPGSVSSATVGGLAPGTAYTFTMVASSTSGDGPASAASPSMTTAASYPAGTFTAVRPFRALDTRAAGGQGVGPGQSIDLPLAGAGGLPATGLLAVVLNVTADQPTSPSYVTVYPTGSAVPTSSNLNFPAGTTVPNLVEVAVGSGGKVSLYNAQGTVQLVVDVTGYYAGGSSGSAYHPVVPARLLDTRGKPFGPIGSCHVTGSDTARPCARLGPGESLDLQVTGTGPVPAGASAVVLNVTAVSPSTTSFLTVYPAGGTLPNSSNLNFGAGATIANRVAVGLSQSGRVTVYNKSGSVDVLVDAGGYYTASGPGSYSPLIPHRALDTRTSPSRRLGPGGSLKLVVAGQAGVPAMGAAAAPTGVVLNVTADGPSTASYLTVYPSDAASRPNASDLNFSSGSVPNLVVSKLSADGAITIYNDQGNVDVIVDVEGWFSN